MKRKVVSVILATAMVASMVAGCGGSNNASTNNAGTTTDAAASDASSDTSNDAAATEAADAGVILFCRLSATNFTHSFFRVQRLCILLPTTFRAELCIVTATALPTVRVRTQWEIQHILSAIMLPKNII